MSQKEPFRIFISYARENLGTAIQLYTDLQRAGLNPWIDKYDLLPGQKWKLEITRAIRRSKFFVALMSQDSVSKRGYVQKELREALEILDEMPEDQIFVIPLRLDECHPSHPRMNDLHWLDLFPDYMTGIQRVLVALGVGKGVELRPEVVAPVITTNVPDESYETLGALALDLERKDGEISKLVKSRLNLLSRLSEIDSIMVTNLLLESHLPTSAMRDLLLALSSSQEEPTEIRAAVRDVCRANTLRGRQIQVPPNTIFTSVRSLDSFGLLLFRHQMFPTVTTARDWIARLSSGDAGLTSLEYDLQLSPFIMWAHPPVERDSIHELTAEEIRIRLGLQHLLQGDSLVLLDYILPEGITPRFPTFCDAYTSELWPSSFRPAPVDAAYGYTVPIHYATPIPEVVHEPIQAKHVISVRMVR